MSIQKKVIRVPFVRAETDDEPSLRALLKQYEKDMNKIDTQIWMLHGQLAGLQDKKLKLQSKVAEVKARLSPFQKLPTELLVRIFVFASNRSFNDLPDHNEAWLTKDKDYGCLSLKTPPINLLHVCHKWRRITLDTPALFSQLVLDGESSTISPIEVLPFWLKKSKQVPFPLSILLPLHDHMHRIRTLDLFVERSVLRTFLPKGRTMEAPVLKRLYLLVSPVENSYTFGTIIAPNLKRLALWGLKPYPIIVHDPKKLVVCKDAASEKGLHDILELFSNEDLEKCDIHHDGLLFRDEPESPPDILGATIKLPKLTHLILGIAHPDELSKVIGKLHIPSLDTLSLAGIGGTLPFHLLQGSLDQCLLASKPPTRSFTLDDVDIDAPSLHCLLIFMPQLESLALTGMNLSSETLGLLNRGSHPDLCPRITHLHLTESMIPFGGLLSIVRTRARPRKRIRQDNVKSRFLEHLFAYGCGQAFGERKTWKKFRRNYPDIVIDVEFESDYYSST